MLFESFSEKILIGLDEEGFGIGDSTKYERRERESLSSFIMIRILTRLVNEDRGGLFSMSSSFQGCQIKGLSVGREKKELER
ncbi:hypothetical protein CDAR_547491 [Caerostris darwini]|uniref:Uncharacterized protein n=1 Tax=Caerostris darwini TaxID=1538125 RepID=A0AAV4VC60_9ARAC|nr:hypothetical protein CDAR_547491 [Caerostris darwini]